MTDRLTVELNDRAYPIYFDEAKHALESEIKKHHSNNKTCFLISDENLKTHHAEFIEALGIDPSKRLFLPSGESTKSIQSYSETLSFLAKQKANRDSILFALGGGVIGDLVGFVAASYLRGIDFYQIPTTLLAMVDSSVGGKTGINLPEGKNLVGAFWQPKSVFIDPVFLESLSKKEFASGLAEIIKYGLIADKKLFQQLLELTPIDKNTDALLKIIRTCCSIKANVVASDEKETAKSGGRALLNLGHTFGHAIENVSGYGDYLHGEAIAIGMHLASLLSEAINENFTEKETQLITELLTKNALPTHLKKPLSIQLLNQAISRDKKNRASGIRYIILSTIGTAESKTGVDPKLIDTLWRKVGAI